MDMKSASCSRGRRSRVRSSIDQRRSVSICSIGIDLLCSIFSRLDHWDLARCSAVCTLWHKCIHNSKMMRERFFDKHPAGRSISMEPGLLKTSMKDYLEKLALNEHILALTGGSTEVYHWTGHSIGVSQSRMKSGIIATGVGDKAIKLWFAESYEPLGDYLLPDTHSLVDFDFDENKVVGLLSAQLCIWRLSGKKSLCQISRGTSSRSLCMRYMDPEAVIGFEDGRARIVDMYSGSCTRIIRMHDGPITCLSLDEQVILGGSSFGKITLADFSSGELVASLKSSFSPIGLTCLCFNKESHRIFAGSTAGYSHCWDIRTLNPLWERRISSNVIYSIDHLSKDASTIASGGIDGVLRILDQNAGEVLSSYILDAGDEASNFNWPPGISRTRKAIMLPSDTRIDSLPRSRRPPISCLAVGMRKIVTTHNDKYIKVWKFRKEMKG